MIRVIKYSELIGQRGKVVGHVFDFEYTNRFGTTDAAQISFGQREYDRFKDTVTLGQYFERKVRESFETDRIANIFEYSDAPAIIAKLGSNVID